MKGIFFAVKPHFGFVKDTDKEKELFVDSDEWINALDGDIVQAKVAGFDRMGRPFGKIEKVLERKITKFVGKITEKKNRTAYIVKPDNNKIFIDFLLFSDKKMDINEKVYVEFKEFKKGEKEGICQLIKILGKETDEGVDILSIALDNGIELDFPDEVQEEVKKIPDSVEDKELEGRVDLRDKVFFTVDPASAKDFDQAQGVEKDGERMILYTHIADVGYYVKKNSKIDIEAKERGNSVYLPDRTIPMLPVELSNGICSLNPDVDRLATTIQMDFDKNLKQVGYKIYKSVIKSRYRMNLQQTDDILKGELDHPLENQLKLMQDIAQKHRKDRLSKGGIFFDSIEIEFKFGHQGSVEGLFKKISGESAKIVEETMLLTNLSVADFLNKNNPSDSHIFRIHEEPKKEKQEFLFSLLDFLQIPKPKNFAKKSLKGVFDQVKDKTSDFLATEMFLRTMEKAIYSIKNKGHYGLGFDNYIHFTAPIRRYGDLVNHRIINSILFKTPVEYTKDRSKDVAKHISDTEVSAMDLERKATLVKQIEYINNKKLTDFTGTISGFSQYGFFVILDKVYASGMVKYDNLPDDFTTDESGFAASGKNRFLKIGDRVQVKIIKADKEEARIDLMLV